MTGCDLSDRGLYCALHRLVFGVIGGDGNVSAVLCDKGVGIFLAAALPWRVNNNGSSALIGDHLHCGYVSLTVANINEVLERIGARLFGRVLVDRAVVVGVFDSFIDAEKELRFICVINR